MIDALGAAAEPNRRRILQLLAGGSRTVGEIAADFTVTRSAISQHLRHLSDAGLVSARKHGRQRIYRLDPGGMLRLRSELDRFWTDELDRLLDDAEALDRGRGDEGEVSVAG